MNVADILDRGIELSVGKDSADIEEQASFLKYLNLAAEELYRATAPLDPLLEKTVMLNAHPPEGEAEDAPLDLGEPILFVKRLVTGSGSFKEVSLSQLDETIFLQKETDPIFAYSGNSLRVYSTHLTKPYPLFIAYVPAFVDFTFDPETGVGTEEKDIPFRKEWHPLLVDGMLYYIHRDMDGAKVGAKETLTVSEWKQGINRYTSALFNKASDAFSPYARV